MRQIEVNPRSIPSNFRGSLLGGMLTLLYTFAKKNGQWRMTSLPVVGMMGRLEQFVGIYTLVDEFLDALHCGLAVGSVGYAEPL